MDPKAVVVSSAWQTLKTDEEVLSIKGMLTSAYMGMARANE